MTLVAAIVNSLLKDTGWRKVDLAGTTNLTSGSLFLRRRGDKVSVECTWVGVGATPALAGFIPAGFRPTSPNTSPQSRVIRATDGTLGVAISVAPASGDVSVAYTTGQTPPTNSAAKWAAEWTTTNAYPTILPGVAA